MKKYSIVPLCYEELTSFENLLKSHYVARSSKRHKTEVINYENNLFFNLTKLQKELKNETYEIKGYKTFLIYEPKMREIQCLSYKDRIVQHTLCDNFLTPYYKNRLILCNCACQENKGSYFARQKLKSFFVDFTKKNGQNGYVLKCDIKKYFASIDHNILKKKLEKLPDKKVKNLIFKIIDSFNFETQKGLPIGNQISQIMGVIFLDSIDRFIKEKLKIKYYIRYMDDLVLIHKSKEYLEFCLEKIVCELSKLNLTLNSKTQISPIRCGVEFLGGRYKLTKTNKVVITVRKQTKKRYNKNLHTIKTLFCKQLVYDDYIMSAKSGLKGHFKGFDAYFVLEKIDFLCDA